MSIRMRWLQLRRRIVPWCMRRGCWQPSHTLQIGSRPPHRGNFCAVHFWEAIATMANEVADV